MTSMTWQGLSPGLRYTIAALCLGMIAVFGSENLFWTAPQEPIKPLEWAVTWFAYSLVAAAALSAVLWAGLSGWRAAFLGGALLGFGVEGVVVTTMYDAFPAQIVWTPLAWHALLTGLLLFALPRALARGPVAVQVAVLLGIGGLGAVWGLYWPSERPVMPGFEVTLPYLAGLALPVVVAHVLLDRLDNLTPPHPVVLGAAPAILLALWLVRVGLTGSAVMLVFPAVVLATVWAMRRLGQAGRPLPLGPAVPAWRHALFLLTPLTVALLVVPLWRSYGAVAVNVPAALGTGALGLGLWLWLLGTAIRPARQAPDPSCEAP